MADVTCATIVHRQLRLIFLIKGAKSEYRDSAQTNVTVDRPMEVVIRREG